MIVSASHKTVSGNGPLVPSKPAGQAVGDVTGLHYRSHYQHIHKVITVLGTFIDFCIYVSVKMIS